MTNEELAELARRARSLRGAGVALTIASAVLALFLFVPLAPGHSKAVSSVEATTTPQAPFITAPIEAKAAIVYDLVTSETLYEKNPGAQLPLASLTKLLTVYAALTVLSPDTLVTVSKIGRASCRERV